MSNPHEMMYINEFTVRSSAAVIRFDEYWKAQHAENKELYPLSLSLLDWLDQFQAWLDMDEFQLPATLHPEILDPEALDGAAKVVPLLRKVVDNEK